jgi:hypothetical protein
MSTKATIDKISVTVGKHKLELTLDEARELKRILNETLEPTVTWPAPVVEKHVYHNRPHYVPVFEPSRTWPRQPEIMCLSPGNIA